MVWTAPKIFIDGAILTADDLNTYARDNLLETAPAKAKNISGYFVTTGQNLLEEKVFHSAQVLTNGQETLPPANPSSNFQDLTTVGPAVTVVTGTDALVFYGATVSSENSPYSSTAWAGVGVSVTGATTIDPNFSGSGDNFNTARWSSKDKAVGQITMAQAFTDLNPGINTFTLQYNNFASIAYFNRRKITVMPL